jgi:hypothetical protein
MVGLLVVLAEIKMVVNLSLLLDLVAVVADLLRYLQMVVLWLLLLAAVVAVEELHTLVLVVTEPHQLVCLQVKILVLLPMVR